MAVGEPARAHSGELRFGLRQRPARPATAHAGHGNRARRARKLPADPGERGLRSGDVAIHAAHLGLQGLQSVADRTGATDQFGILRFEGEAALLGSLQLGLAVFELLVEEDDRIGDFTAIAGDIVLAENIDQALDDFLRQLGVLGIAQIALADGRGYFEQVFLLALDRHRLGETVDRALHFAIGRDVFAQTRAADHLFEIDPARQCLAHPGHFLLAVARDVELFGQDVIKLHVKPRLAHIAVGDHGDHEPAEDADAPGHRQRQPAAVPHLVQRCAQFLEDFVHRGIVLRRPIRG